MFDLTNTHQFKRQVSASFDATPANYGTDGDFHWQFAQRLVEHAPSQPSQTVLDVATGTAPAAIMAAQRLDPVGRVIGIDLSPGITALARGNVAAAKLHNVHIVVGDAEELGFGDAIFDGILCSSAIVWFPDIARALREWRRVLRPHGWIAFSCFGGLARQTINDLVIRLLQPYGVAYPELNTPLNTSEKCRQLILQAGFHRIEVHTTNAQQFPLDADDSFRRAWASGSRFNIALPPAVVAEIQAQYVAAFAAFIPDQARWNHDYEQFVTAYKGEA